LRKDINAEYVRYFLQSKNGQDALGAYTGGSVQQVINLGDLRMVEVPLPPLPEQQRIVSVLDEAFASITEAKSNAERNLVNARELFESISKDVFDTDGKEWEEKKLGDKDIIEIIDSDRGVNYPKKKDFHPEGYCLFMNTKNVRPDGFDFSTKMFITEEKDKALRKGKLSRNDVVMTTRGTIGNLGVYTDDVPFEQIRTNSGMLIFRPNTKQLVPEFLFEVLRSGTIKAQINKHVSGAAQPQLPIKTLVNFTFHIPRSLAEQRAIVGRLEALSAETKRLEEIFAAKVQSLEELKRSVLGKAFAGEL
jgi:restriction endonuclease S subunit